MVREPWDQLFEESPSFVNLQLLDERLTRIYVFRAFFLLFFNRSRTVNEQMPIGGNITHRCNVKRRGAISRNGIIFHYANLISFKEDSQTISYVEAILTGISNIIGLTDWGIVNCAS